MGSGLLDVSSGVLCDSFVQNIVDIICKVRPPKIAID